ncbi:MAG: TIGR02281 family clan AA aspartic protease [Saprospiraceae bacterium]
MKTAPVNVLRLPLLSIFLFFSVVYSSAQSLDLLLKTKQFFQLAQQLPKYAKQLKPFETLVYQAFVDNAFNRNAASNAHIVKLLDSKKVADSVKARLLLTKLDNDFKLYHYGAAAQTVDRGKKDFAAYYDQATLASLDNMRKLYGAFAEVPAQEVRISGDFEVNARTDKANLVNIPVHFSQDSMEFIFDTGANMSVIVESLVERLNIQVQQERVEVQSFSGPVMAKVGYCPSLRIGKAEFRNVAFLIFPDSTLDFKSIQYKITGILGFSVIQGLGEIHMYQGKKLAIKAQPSETTPNLFLDGLDAVVAVDFQSDTLLFNFDTGAKNTDLFNNFYITYKDRTDLEFTDKQTVMHGGAGAKQVIGKNLKQVTFTIAGKPFQLKNLTIPDSIPMNRVGMFGNIGQDAMRQYPVVVLNLQDLYVRFE